MHQYQNTQAFCIPSSKHCINCIPKQIKTGCFNVGIVCQTTFQSIFIAELASPPGKITLSAAFFIRIIAQNL
jgi:hypothetical protein